MGFARSYWGEVPVFHGFSSLLQVRITPLFHKHACRSGSRLPVQREYQSYQRSNFISWRYSPEAPGNELQISWYYCCAGRYERIMYATQTPLLPRHRQDRMTKCSLFMGPIIASDSFRSSVTTSFTSEEDYEYRSDSYTHTFPSFGSQTPPRCVRHDLSFFRKLIPCGFSTTP